MITKDDIKIARKGAKSLGELDAQDRHDALEGILKRTYALKGYSVEGPIVQEVEAILTETEPRISSRHSRLTLGEVALAWEAGVCGDFGADTRITIATLIAWTSKYSQLEERKEAIEELYQESRPSHLLPARDIEARNRDACRRWALSQWEHYKQHDDLEKDLLDGFAVKIYEYLESLHKVNPSEETQRAARLRAEKRLKEKGKVNALRLEVATQNAYKAELLRMYYGSLKARGVELRI